MTTTGRCEGKGATGGRGAVEAGCVEAILRARADLRPAGPWFPRPPEAEGGCGVTGFACTIPVGGRHIYEPSIQMRNRGNGKGGGIAACGLVPEDLGVSRKVLEEDYLLQVALLDPTARREVEEAFIEPCFEIDQGGMIPTVDDYRDVPLLQSRPPDVMRYFVRVKPAVLSRFAEEKALGRCGLAERELEDEFVYQNSVRLNDRFYASLGEKQAFVLSHACNLLIVKIVGYAEAAVQYYRMPDMRAHVWIAHQRYPTKGRVWQHGRTRTRRPSNAACKRGTRSSSSRICSNGCRTWITTAFAGSSTSGHTRRPKTGRRWASRR